MRRQSSKRKRTAAHSPTPDDPVRMRRTLNVITIGIAAVIAIILMLFLQSGLWKNTDDSPEAIEARKVAAEWARVENDWQRVRSSRSEFWGHYVADAPQHLVPFASLLRTVAEKNICQDNPGVDGKILSYEQLEKVAILREYQCLEYARDDLVRIANSEEGVGFLGSTMAHLREEYQSPLSEPAPESPVENPPET